VKIDPNLAVAHLELGNAYRLDFNWRAARMEWQRARELDPSDDSVHLSLPLQTNTRAASRSAVVSRPEFLVNGLPKRDDRTTSDNQ
jgi:hypothetical protein